MVTQFIKALGATAGAAAIALMTVSTGALAHQTTGEAFPHTHDGGQQRVIQGERYIPTIWVDPDGCEHWVMDDGWEGYMTLKVDRNGKPTCRGGSVCATLYAHGMFEKNGVWLTHKGKQHIMSFFQSQRASSYKIIGHTDVSGSDRSNMKLSKGRAMAVAQVAQSQGARIVGVDGYGGRAPLGQPGNWKHNPKNHRVEIICLR
ncbi:MAG: OmpA family protein [Pseudomonadota bacterium]